MKFLGTPRVAGALDLNDNKPQFGKGLVVTKCRGKRPQADTAALRARLDVVDDGIFLLWVEISGCVHHTVDVRLAVASLY